MDTLKQYRRIIRDVLTELTVVPFAYGDLAIETVFDETTDRYIVMIVGWNRDSRAYGPLAHVDIIDGKFWIQRDGTEEGIPVMLMERGIPKEHIVIAYRPLSEQKYMGFALAE